MGRHETLMGDPAVLVTVSMGVISFAPESETYTVWPLGVMATAVGSSPTGIAVPVVFVARSIGVTVLPL